MTTADSIYTEQTHLYRLFLLDRHSGMVYVEERFLSEHDAWRWVDNLLFFECSFILYQNGERFKENEPYLVENLIKEGKSSHFGKPDRKEKDMALTQAMKAMTQPFRKMPSVQPKKVVPKKQETPFTARFKDKPYRVFHIQNGKLYVNNYHGKYNAIEHIHKCHVKAERPHATFIFINDEWTPCRAFSHQASQISELMTKKPEVIYR